MAKDSLNYFSKDQVRSFLAHVNNIDHDVKIDVTILSKKNLFNLMGWDSYMICYFIHLIQH